MLISAASHWHTVLNWDPSIDWTGVGTILLAVATVVLALQTRSAAQATAAEAATTRAELDASQRPIIVASSIIVKKTAESTVLSVELRNVGPGPALDALADMTPYGGESPRVFADHGVILGAGDTHAARLPLHGDDGELLDQNIALLHIRCADVAGSSWHTYGLADLEQGTFFPMQLGRREDFDPPALFDFTADR